MGAKNTTDAVVLNAYAKYTHTHYSFISCAGRTTYSITSFADTRGME
jgi:hypothetical protein